MSSNKEEPSTSRNTSSTSSQVFLFDGDNSATSLSLLEQGVPLFTGGGNNMTSLWTKFTTVESHSNNFHHHHHPDSNQWCLRSQHVDDALDEEDDDVSYSQDNKRIGHLIWKGFQWYYIPLGLAVGLLLQIVALILAKSAALSVAWNPSHHHHYDYDEFDTITNDDQTMNSITATTTTTTTITTTTTTTTHRSMYILQLEWLFYLSLLMLSKMTIGLYCLIWLNFVMTGLLKIKDIWQIEEDDEDPKVEDEEKDDYDDNSMSYSSLLDESSSHYLEDPIPVPATTSPTARTTTNKLSRTRRKIWKAITKLRLPFFWMAIPILIGLDLGEYLI